MANYTPNLNLKKPLTSEYYDMVADLNDTKDKIDNHAGGVLAQLAQIAYNMTALAGDGMINDSPTIQSIINLAIANKVKKLKFPKSTYRMNSPIYASGDDLEIDFSGSTIHSYAKANANVWGEIGLFNFHGSIVGGEIITYMRTAYTNPSPPLESPLLLTYQNHVETVENSTFYGGKITTSNNAYFTVGDDVFLRGWTRPTGAPYDATLYEPELTVVAKVTKIDGTYVYVDYYSPFTYPTFIQSSIFKSVAIKCSLLKNIKIKNLKVIDKTTLVTGGFTPTANEVQESISIIAPILCDNIEIENVEVEDHRANAINPFYCRNIEMKNIKAKNARMWGGGQGYLTQIRGCRDIKVNDVVGIACRHVVDFSFSCYGKVTNAKGINGRSTDLGLHGICEHDITFENCEGYTVIGNGIQYFPNIVKNVNFHNCDVEFHDRVDDISGNEFVDNVVIKDSRIIISHLFDFLNVECKDTKITWKFRGSNRVLNKRNVTMTTSCKFKDCDFFIVHGVGINYRPYFRDYDTLTLKDLSFVYDSSLTLPTTGVVFELLSIKDLIIDNVKVNNTKFRYQNLIHSLAKYQIKDSQIIYSSAENYAFLIDTLTNCTLVMDIGYNDIQHVGAAAQFFGLDARNTNKINSFIKGIVHDNKFIGNTGAKIHYIHGGVTDPLKLKAYIYDYNNMIEFRDIAGSVMWSTTKNNIIS